MYTCTYLLGSGLISNIVHSAKRPITEHCNKVCAPLTDAAKRINTLYNQYSNIRIERWLYV